MRRTCTLRRSVHPSRSRARGNRRWTRRHVSRLADRRPKVAPHLDNISLGAPRSVASKILFLFSRGLQRGGEALDAAGKCPVLPVGRKKNGAAPNQIFTVVFVFRVSAGEPSNPESKMSSRKKS